MESSFQQFEETFTFDDVLLTPQESDVLPADVDISTTLTDSISLTAPFVSAAMDTVTEHRMAIALALAGGFGVIHKNLSVDQQVEQVRRVKRFKNGFIQDPLTVLPHDGIEKVVAIRNEYGYKKIPVVDSNGKLVGLISDVDYSLPEHAQLLVKDRMAPKKDLVFGSVKMTLAQAQKKLIDHRLRVLCVITKDGKLASIVTRKDLEKNLEYRDALKDDNGQLRVGAAIGVGKSGIDRAFALHAAHVDIVVIDTAHGHSRAVIDTVKQVKKEFPDLVLIAGNIATPDAAIALAQAGADVLKVGIGPGSICTTRIIAGVGVPQLSALLHVRQAIKKIKKSIRIISDGGIKSSGDIVKALAAGADAIMMGNMFAGTEETPGRIELTSEGTFKVYRGMGSIEAMEHGSKDRYGQQDISEKRKFVPEGVSGRIPYRGPVSRMIYQLAGGLKSGMGYCGARTIPELQKKARFVRITQASIEESHPHNLAKIESAPNYSIDE